MHFYTHNLVIPLLWRGFLPKILFLWFIGINYLQQVRLTYSIIQMGFQALAFFIILGLRIIFSPLKSLMECTPYNETSCLNFGIIFRISLSLIVLQVILSICLLFRNSFARIVNEGVWGIKICISLLIFFLSLIVPDTLIRFYGWVTKFSSCLVHFLIFVVFSDISYIYSRYLFSNFHGSENKIK